MVDLSSQVLSQFVAKTSEEKSTNFVKLSQEKKHKRLPLPQKAWQRVLLLVGLSLLLILVAVGTYTYQVAMQLKQQAMATLPVVAEAKYLLATQNLPTLPEKVQVLRAQQQQLESTYRRLSFYNYLPIVRNYYKDGLTTLQIANHGVNIMEQSVNALMPYAQILGFVGEGSFSGGTTQDRIVLLLDTLSQIEPTINTVETELNQAVALLQTIDPKRYPKQFGEHQVREQLIKAQETASLVSHSFADYKPLIGELSKMAGAKEAQKYLVLFQNDNELRPTGGFLTAYAIINVDKGVVNSEKSDDIYELDLKFKQRIPIPSVLGRYLTTEKYFHLRDMNISPDFKTAMQEFYQYYGTVPGESKDIDGIIAVDTQVLTDLLRVIGPIEVPGYGVFTAEDTPKCDCPQVVYALSEIITKPTPYLREDRKGVLGPLMKGILQKTYDLEKSRFPELIQVAIGSIEGRHLQMYFMDEATQKAAEQINAAGRLYALKDNFKGWQIGENADFLAIVDANLGGAKSNLFTDYQIKQSVAAPVDGRLQKTVEITYKNSRKADNCNLEAGQLCLNSTLNDWLRIYVPKGSELIEIQGISNEANVYEEEGLTVIDGYFNLEPLGLAKIKLTYTIPYTDATTYNLRLWKQGGINPVPMVIDVTGGEEELLLDKDQDYSTVF